MVNRVCSIEGCGRGGRLVRGWCWMHYSRWRRNGDPEVRGSIIVGDGEARFWAKINKTSGCWLWTATLNNKGYGIFWLDGRVSLAHRVSYERFRGPIPEKLAIDHLCRTPACVNPEHLEVVTFRENILRGEGCSAREARQGSCLKGHRFDEVNTYRYVDKHGSEHRMCRACSRIRDRRRRSAKVSV